ncbi:hypothetical protein DTO164E3_7507 [Paecilomyces variotii]|nr:hypothetical protein DTO032I3_8241 [Paecilomyces variotii]KAJ9194079.1 hypothetical protein DTO164E3_7507 [Paecilomyces variotii]KAJ9231828.1 hypothetical protein DTO169E5_7813 [Paecilomyces variotii]KAJ9277907.1 hypothetical protein DTO021D3_5231 [Paecilomyces variotii]KAJ9287136.1 hypothetical protein DTO021C3_5272 [Paecilomyces variotii]
MNQRSASLIDKDRPGRSWLRLRTRPATRQTFSPVYARSVTIRFRACIFELYVLVWVIIGSCIRLLLYTKI